MTDSPRCHHSDHRDADSTRAVLLNDSTSDLSPTPAAAPSSRRPFFFPPRSRSPSKRRPKNGQKKPRAWWTRPSMRLAFLALPLINKKHRQGQEWIYGALFRTIEAACILILNLALFLTAVRMGYNGSPPDKTNLVSIPIYEGKCTVANRWSTGLHVIINILSTWLLAASNYVMQCLNAPSREDLDRAHPQGRWLYIGTWSFKNFREMDWKRKTLWGLLFLSSTPIHLFYNSVVFPSISTQEYGKILIPDDFQRGDTLVRDDDPDGNQEMANNLGYSVQELHAEIFNGTLQKLTPAECATRYAKDYNTEGSTVVVVTGDTRPFDPWGRSFVPSYQYGVAQMYQWMYESHRLMDSRVTKVEDVVTFAQMNQWSVVGTWWSYPRWNFTAPTDQGDLRQFDTGPSFSGFYVKNNETDVLNDLTTLYWFIVEQNPTHNQMSQKLTTEANWNNSTWIQHLRFTDGNSTGREILSPLNRGHMARPGPYRDYHVSHCLSKDATQRCQLLFSMPVALIVLACNCIKVVCMFLSAKSVHRRDVLLTVGDAVASFLTRPDPTTRGRCLLSRTDIKRQTEIGTITRCEGLPQNSSDVAMDNLPTTRHHDQLSSHPKTLSRRRYRWLRASSSLYWSWFVLFFSSCIATGAGLYHFGAWTNNGISSISQAWALGFGKINPQTLVTGPDWPENLLKIILLVNLPQILLSIIYFICNGLLTRMLLAVEYNDYAVARKPLRVSWPVGQQRRTYYISLPYRYGLPMIIVSIVLHWLLSQSWFLVKIRAFDVNGKIVPVQSVTTCGYSLAAMFLTLVIGGFAIVMVFILGLIKFNSNMPLASYCSIAISAACHPPPWDQDAALKPVMWGEVAMQRDDDSASSREEDSQRNCTPESPPGYAHCAFSSLDVVTPNTTSLYC